MSTERWAREELEKMGEKRVEDELEKKARITITIFAASSFGLRLLSSRHHTRRDRLHTTIFFRLPTLSARSYLSTPQRNYLSNQNVAKTPQSKKSRTQMQSRAYNALHT